MNNPYASPQAPTAGLNNSQDPLLPSRWKRLWAAVIDGTLAIASGIPVWLYKAFVLNLPWYSEDSMTGQVVIFIYCAIVFALMHGYFIYKNGQTIGKRIVGIKIVSAYYSKADILKVLFLRTYLFWLLSYVSWMAIIWIAGVLMIFRKDKRCLHDHIAGTTVVDGKVTLNVA